MLRRDSAQRGRRGSAPTDDAALPRRYAQAGLSHAAAGLSPARPAGQRPDRRRGFAAALSYSRPVTLFSPFPIRLVPMPHRHCERSEAIQGCRPDALDGVATLAMTAGRRMLRRRAIVSTFTTFAAGTNGPPPSRRPGLEPGPRFLSIGEQAGPRLKAGVTEAGMGSITYGSSGQRPPVRVTTPRPQGRMLRYPASVSTFATFAPRTPA